MQTDTHTHTHTHTPELDIIQKGRLLISLQRKQQFSSFENSSFLIWALLDTHICDHKHRNPMFAKCVSDIFLPHFLSALLCKVPYLLIEHTEKEHDIYQHVNTHTNIHILISDSHVQGKYVNPITLPGRFLCFIYSGTST